MTCTRRELVRAGALGAVGSLLAACAGLSSEPHVATTGASVSPTPDSSTDARKPVVFYNRQPLDASGAPDVAALSWNDDTYYVGADAEQGGRLQGQMVLDYLKAHSATLDRGDDQVIGYVLAIGDLSQADSLARTRGVRQALGTAVERDGVVIADPVGVNEDGRSDLVRDATLQIADKVYTIRELASREMRNADGVPWDRETARAALDEWVAAFGDRIDVVIGNNDGMAMELFDHWAHAHEVPTFGYDGTPDAIAAVGAGLAGTVTQNSSVQAYLTLRLLRNALDGAERDRGIAQADEQGNVLPADCYRYDPDARSYYVANMAITEFNYQEHLKDTRALDVVSRQLDERSSPLRRVWLSIYCAADDYLDSTYQPLLALYDGPLNLDVDYIGGNGEDDDNVLARLTHPEEYDAYAINLIATGNAQAYLRRLA